MMGKRTAWVAAALLAYAAPATAVEFFGYMRDAIGGNNKGGALACFRTPGMDYKLRLGNECDNYAEWGFQQSIWKDKNGVEFTVGFMFDYFPDVMLPTGATFPFGIQQGYVKAKFPMWRGAQFWAGKQYYRRENIDMIDFFYLNTSDPGFGVEDLDLGFAKIAASVFATKQIPPPAQSTVPPPFTGQGEWRYAFWRPDVRIYGIPINPNGSLEVDVNLIVLSKRSGAPDLGAKDGTTSVWFTVEHTQEKLLGGSNKALVQWANGAAASMGVGPPSLGSDPVNKDNRQLRVIDQLLLQPSTTFQILVGTVIQWKTQFVGPVKTDIFQWGVFGRPIYWLTPYFKLQGDAGYTRSDPNNGDAVNLIKATFAPTLSPSVGKELFFVRPELRLFVTYAHWNDATIAAGGPSPQINFGTDNHGFTYGMSVETWF